MGLRVNLTAVTRATGRMPATVLGWIRESEGADADERAARDDLFAAIEVRHETSVRGRGFAWTIDLDAAERVHRARGGVAFYREAALPLARVPQAVLDELEALRGRVATLERENARLRSRTPSAYVGNAVASHASYTGSSGKPATSSATGASSGNGPRATDRAANAPVLHAPTEDELAVAREGIRFAAITLDEARELPLATFPLLPRGWMPLSRWSTVYAMNYRTVTALISEGRLPAEVRGAWRVGPNNLARAIWSPSQLENVLDCFAYVARHSQRTLSATLLDALASRLAALDGDVVNEIAAEDAGDKEAS